MDLFLNAGFNDLLGEQTLRLIHELGFAGVRQDATKEDRPWDLEHIRELCREIALSKLGVILIVNPRSGNNEKGWDPIDVAEQAGTVAVVASELGLLAREQPCAIEIGNEPNLDKSGTSYQHDPNRFAELIRRSQDSIRKSVTAPVTVLSGGISNLNRDGLDYLREAVRAGIPEDVAVGYHSYRTTATPETPNGGFGSRVEEFRTLRSIAGARRLWCTECGWHTALSVQKTVLGKKKIKFNDEQVAEFVSREARLHFQFGAEAFTLFQLNDREEDCAEARFGIRHTDLSLKPVAHRIRDLAREVGSVRSA